MDSAQTNSQVKYLTLKQAAEILAVTIETLLEWNGNNILKPTITQSGDVGYTQEQIDKFLAIQQLSQNNNTNKEKTITSPLNQNLFNKLEVADSQHTSGTIENEITSYTTEYNINKDNVLQADPSINTKESLVNSDNLSTAHSTIKPSKAGNKKTSSYIFISTFSVFVIIIIAALSTQQNITQFQNNNIVPSIQNEIDNTKTVTRSKISEVKLLGSNTPAIGDQMENIEVSDSMLNKPGISIPDNKLTTPLLMTRKVSETTESDTQNQLPIVAFLEQENSSGLLFDSNLDAINSKHNTTLSSASRTNTGPSDTKIFGDNDYIGKVISNDPIANLAVNPAVLSGKSLQQTTDITILLVLLTAGLLFIVFIPKNQPAYSLIKTNIPGTSPNPETELHDQKVLEIDQKTDGTVVLYFQGKEFKISKPELNSESDQFIERLLGVEAPDVKNIKYDIFKDEKIKLNAPLSKLVTRLGFVGVKRELFFPRTSKNKVLFRRYITRRDLASMGLTTDQISNELAN